MVVIDKIRKFIIGEGVVPLEVGEAGGGEERGEGSARIGLDRRRGGVIIETDEGLTKMIFAERGKVLKSEFVFDGENEFARGFEVFSGKT